LLPPLTPLAMRGRLRERLLPAPGWDDQDALAVTQVLPQLWLRVSFSIALLHHHPGCHPRWWSSGVTTSTSSLSPPSTRRPRRGGISHPCSILAPPSMACTPSVACAPSVVRTPLVEPNAHPPAQHRAPMVSYAMADLRAEINCHRSGEDSRITIEP
jgi:hypothetical protein